MSDATLAAWIEILRQSRVLEPKQLNEVTQTLQHSSPDEDALTQELLRRGWLTPYQVARLREGTGNDLLLGDEYVLLDLLGEGGMGQVFKARHRVMHRVVAVKVIRKDRLSTESAVSRFHQEIRAAAQLAHPNVILAYDARQVGDLHFFVMEYVQGTDLSRLVKEQGPPAPEQACDYIRQAALGLQHAHERGLVHRDIKPSNLLLSVPGGIVKILDMGLARVNLEGQGPQSFLTQAGEVMGTPDYMSPEQALDSRTADIRSDIYSLGCSLYYLLSGQVPFPRGNMVEKMYRHRFQEPEPIERVAVEMPPGLEKVVHRMMAKPRADRYQTPAEVAAALTPFCVPPGSIARSGLSAAVPRSLAGPTTGPAGGSAPKTVREGATRTREVVEETRDQSSLVTSEGPCRTAGEPAPTLVRTGRGGLWLKTGVAVALVLGIARAAVWWARQGGQPADTTAATATGQPRGTPNPPTEPAADGTSEPARLPGDWWPAVACLWAGSPAGSLGHLPWQAALDPAFRARLPQAAPAAAPTVELPLGLRELIASLAFGPGVGFPGGPPWAALVRSSQEKGMPYYGMPNPGPEPGLLYSLAGHRHGVTSAVIGRLPEGLRALSAGKDARLRLWDLDHDGREVRNFPITASEDDYPDLIWSVALSADGRRAVAGSGGFFDERDPDAVKEGRYSEGKHHLVTLWPVDTGEEITLGRHDGIVRAVAISTDGRRVLSGGDDGKLRLWNVPGKRLAREFRPEGAAMRRVQGVAFSRDGERAASADDHFVRLWHVSTGRQLNRLEWRDRFNRVPVTSVAFLPDGRVVFGTRESKTNLIVWDPSKENEDIALAGHPDGTTSVAVSADGHRLFSGGADGSVAVWDLLRNRRLASFTVPGHRAEITCVAIAPDGRRGVSGSADGGLAVWALPP